MDDDAITAILGRFDTLNQRLDVTNRNVATLTSAVEALTKALGAEGEKPQEVRLVKTEEDELIQRILDVNISVLGLTAKTQGALTHSAEKIDTVGRLVKFSEERLLRVRGIDQDEVKEIQAKLSERCLGFRLCEY